MTSFLIRAGLTTALLLPLLALAQTPAQEAAIRKNLVERLPGLQLRVASTPQQGLQMATDDPPQLLLLDIQLPGMDGFELLRRLRAHPRTTRENGITQGSCQSRRCIIRLTHGYGGFQSPLNPCCMRHISLSNLNLSHDLDTC
jgi:response regulator RpfG family c-di-GMP phosphodiesterase